MIAYFSGTGNSRFVAHRLSKQLDEKSIFIPATDPSTVTFEGDSLGLIIPVYAWGVPPLVTDWIRRLSKEFRDTVRKAGAYVWLVLTCGDDTGMAPEVVEDALNDTGLKLNAVWSVQMPNVYVLLPGFDVDSHEVEQHKLEEARDRIHHIGVEIGKHILTIDVNRGSMPRLKTKLIYPLFKRWGINFRKWHWTKECIGCGACASACPVKNIKMRSSHPVWGKNCVSCLACYHVCPTHAVEYGCATTNRGQYYLRRLKE